MLSRTNVNPMIWKIENQDLIQKFYCLRGKLSVYSLSTYRNTFEAKFLIISGIQQINI